MQSKLQEGLHAVRASTGLHTVNMATGMHVHVATSTPVGMQWLSEPVAASSFQPQAL